MTRNTSPLPLSGLLGLPPLIAARKELRGRAGSLLLVPGTGRIAQVLRITGLTDAFALHSCVLEAVTADLNWQAAVSAEGSSAGI